MDPKVFLRGNETFDDFYKRCNNMTVFDCSEEEMLWWMMGSRRLPLSEIVPISVVLVVIFLTGVVGNVCVCVVIVRHPGLHTATNYYLFSLAVSDLLLLLFGLPNDLSVYWHQYPYSLGLVFCKLRALISEAATYVSVLTISAFSLERYLAICHPLHLYAMAGLTRACRIIVVLWILSVLCAAPFAVYTDISYRDYPPNSGNQSLDSAFCALMAPSPLLELSSIFFFFLPAVLILCLYVRMGLHIRSTRVIEKSKSLLTGHVHGETRQAKSRKAIIRMLAAVVIAFFVCWAPFHIQRLFYIYGYELPQFLAINEHLFNVAGALYYVSATVNPILYNVMSGRYRVAFQETLLCRKIERRDSRATTFDLNSCRETSLSTYGKSVRQKRESRIAFISKVDFIKEDPSPFCADEESKLDETVIYYYKEKNGHLENGAVAGTGRDFPPGFKFGAASASYQVEGAWDHADKGESTWDRFTHTHPELTKGGATGDVACDSFHKWQDDVDLAASLGLHFYRFSMSWPRLLPSGFTDKISEVGTKYYNNLIDGLLAKGIEPVVTLYHWDLPQRLQDLGGWTNPLIAEWFGDYARVVYSLYGDRVKLWLTINEPIVVCDTTYVSGVMAPGVHDPDVAPHLCAKNLLLAHAKAYRIYDNEFRSKYNGKVSLANHAVWLEPESDSAEDAELAELAMQVQVGRFAHAIFGAGGWPLSVERLVEENSRQDGHQTSRLPKFTQEEIDFIKGTFDFFGVNHYTSRVVKPAPRKPWSTRAFWPMFVWPELPVEFDSRPEWPSGENFWLKVYPSGLRKMLVWLKQQYGDVPILITENGYATVGSNLVDDQRVEYYEQYLETVLEAIREGVNVTGYTAWTLLDNFEWMDGYDTKFGLHEVDFSDPLRPRKARRSARYYASVIKHHSLDVPDTEHKDEL